jgi:hypothetical protein
MIHTLVLISCSNGKQRGGVPRYRVEDCITAYLPMPTSQRMLFWCKAIRERFFRARWRIGYGNVLRSETGKVENDSGTDVRLT